VEDSPNVPNSWISPHLENSRKTRGMSDCAMPKTVIQVSSYLSIDLAAWAKSLCCCCLAVKAAARGDEVEGKGAPE